MSQTRLTGLALLHIHYNMDIDFDEILNSQICKASSKENGTGKYIVWLTQKARKPGKGTLNKIKKNSWGSMLPDLPSSLHLRFAVNRWTFFQDPPAPVFLSLIRMAFTFVALFFLPRIGPPRGWAYGQPSPPKIQTFQIIENQLKRFNCPFQEDPNISEMMKLKCT